MWKYNRRTWIVEACMDEGWVLQKKIEASFSISFFHPQVVSPVNINAIFSMHITFFLFLINRQQSWRSPKTSRKYSQKKLTFVCKGIQTWRYSPPICSNFSYKPRLFFLLFLFSLCVFVTWFLQRVTQKQGSSSSNYELSIQCAQREVQRSLMSETP